MKKELIFRDQIKLSQPRIYKDSQSLVSDIFSNKSSKVGLKIAIRATHSGYLLNSRVYPGVFVERSVGSWTEGYNKPIILDHDQEDSKKVLGRVHGATFHKLKEGNEFLHDYKRPGTGKDFGSGFIMLDAVINDEDAIVKMLDGRYNTVSTGQKPLAAKCNICAHDWINYKDSDRCEHVPGKIYQIGDNEMPCFLVTGMLQYRECSIVTNPANINAQIVSANIDSLQQYSSKDNENTNFIFNCIDSGDIKNLELINADGDSLSLLFKDGKDELPSSAKNFTKTSISLTDGEPMTKKDDKKTTEKADSVLDSWIADAVKKPVDSKQEENKTEDSAKKDVVEDKTATSKEEKTQPKSDPLMDELKTENNKLKSQVDSLTTEKDKFKGQVEEKDGLIQTLTSQVTDLRKSQVNEAARTLAIMRGVSGKKEIIQSKDSFDKYVKELSTRSIDSLKDSIADSLPELSNAINASVKTLSVAVIDKVEDPTLKRSQNDRESADGKNGKNELKDKNSYLDEL